MRFLSFFLFFLFICTAVHAQNVPSPEGFVLDTADALTTEQEAVLETRLNAIEETTSVEIAVFIFSSLEGGDMFEYTQRTFDTWKIGQEENDNGLLIAISTEDREWRIHTGYGLEGVLPDGLAYMIGDKKMVPFLAEGDYYGGISVALDDVEGILQNNPEVVAEYEEPPIEFELFNSGFLMGGVALLLFAALLAKMFMQIPKNKLHTQGIGNVFFALFSSAWIAGIGSMMTLFALNGVYPFTLLSLVFGYWLVFSHFPWDFKSGSVGTGIGGMGMGGFGRGSGGFGGGGFGGGMSGGGGAGGKF